MKHRIQGAWDFLRRYGAVMRSAWAVRRQMEPVRRRREELEFLPAHLELVDTPASPSARWMIRLIVLFFCVAVAWAWIGHVDVVAVASGKTVASSRTKVIQPLEAGTVRAIHVEDGTRVRAGQLLIELDSSATGADAGQASESLSEASLREARLNAELAALASEQPPASFRVALATPEANTAANRLAQSEFAAFVARHTTLETEVSQRRAELTTLRNLIVHLDQAYMLAKRRAEDVKALLPRKFASQHDWLTAEQTRVDAEGQLAAQRNRIAELEASINAKREEAEALRAEFGRELEEGLREAAAQRKQLDLELGKARHRDDLMRITAPVDGTVQQLSVHTVGGVVTPAQPLLSIVPDEDSLEVEAIILNRDIGFVRAGDAVSVKVESFPYTRYGYLQGIVTHVSHDALPHETLGPVFHARIRLLSSTVEVEGVPVHMSAGMSVVAEIKTGKRRVADYLLDPLTRTSKEAMRER